MHPPCSRASNARSRSSSNIADRGPGRIVVAPDKFKGSLTAIDAAAAIERGLRAVWPRAHVDRVPMADGGEGTVDAFVASGWSRVVRRVRGPLGDPVDATFAFRAAAPGGGAAVIEMASASGLGLLPASRYDPLRASTFGTGELVCAALDCGARRVVVGLGGSATTDAGVGFLQALGFGFYDAASRALEPGGAALAELARIDRRNADPRLAETTFVAAVDVDNPLTGTRGASRHFGPQKGATPSDVARLDAALAHVADVAARTLGTDERTTPGSGAAGGLGFAMRAFLGADVRPGVDVVAETRGLARLLAGAALCCTGEGRVDATTLAGKTVAGVIARAHAAGVATLVFAGAIDARAEAELASRGAVAFPIADGPLDARDAMAQAADLLERAATRAARTIALDARS